MKQFDNKICSQHHYNNHIHSLMSFWDSMSDCFRSSISSSASFICLFFFFLFSFSISFFLSSQLQISKGFSLFSSKFLNLPLGINSILFYSLSPSSRFYSFFKVSDNCYTAASRISYRGFAYSFGIILLRMILENIVIMMIVVFSTNPSFLPQAVEPSLNSTLVNNAKGVAPLTSPLKNSTFSSCLDILNAGLMNLDTNQTRYMLMALPKTNITITTRQNMQEWVIW